MSYKLEQLSLLQQMLDDDLIDQDEYARLKAEVLDVDGAPVGGQRRVENYQTPGIYMVSLGLGIASIFYGSWVGLLAWVTTGFSIWALVQVRIPKGRWMAWSGLVSGLIYSFTNLYLNGHLDF